MDDLTYKNIMAIKSHAETTRNMSRESDVKVADLCNRIDMLTSKIEMLEGQVRMLQVSRFSGGATE